MSGARSPIPANEYAVFGEVEAHVPVEDWTLDGIPYWPFERYRVRRQIIEKVLRPSREIRPWASMPQTDARVMGASPSMVFPGLYSFPERPFRSARTLLLTGCSQYQVQYRGRRLNRFLDAYALLNDPEEIQFLSLTVVRDCYLQPSILQAEYKPWIEKLQLNLPGLSQYNELLDSHGLARFCAEDALPYLASISVRVRNFRLLFERFEFEEVGTACYYNAQRMCGLHAAKLAGCRTFDLQHGRLGPKHGMYTDFRNGSEYSCTPDVVYLWDERTATFFEPGGFNYEVRGNYWLKFREAHLDEFQTSSPQQGRPTFLVTLQTRRPLAPHLLAVARKTKDLVQWVFRLHPGDDGHHEDFVSMIQAQIGPGDWQVVRARDADLVSQLQAACGHATPFSSCTIEAAATGRHTALLEPAFAHVYSDFIDDGLATLCGNEQTLSEFVLRSIRAHNGSHAEHTTSEAV